MNRKTSNDRRTPKKNNRIPFLKKVIWSIIKLLLLILRVVIGFDDE